MGRIIRLPSALLPYPRTSAELDRGESVLLLAVRWWTRDTISGDDPLPRLCRALDRADAHDAAFSIDGLMSVIARTVRRPMAIHCPRCPGLSEDEVFVLHAASLVQGGEEALAARVLRTTLLSAQGAEFALGPLEGIARMFGAARLILRRRRVPGGAVSGGPDAAAVSAFPLH